jgi:hypothetical protein
MTAAWFSVLSAIGAMFLIMLAGWIARRRNYFSEETTSALGRFVVDVTFPALTFTQMLKTVDAASLRGSGGFFLLAIGVLGLGFAMAYAASFACGRSVARPSFVFLAGMPNWIFLPLALAPSLLGEQSVRLIILFNIPAQVMLWTLGVWILRGGFRGSHSIRHLLTNTGLLATAAGIVLAAAYPSSREWAGSRGATGTLIHALTLVGGMTVPLSLVVTGAQLGGIGIRAGFSIPLAAVLVVRLIATPVVTVLLVMSFVPLSADMKAVSCLIASMPVGVSSGLFIERFGGDRDLSARAISLSTLLSLLTVPVIVAIFF